MTYMYLYKNLFNYLNINFNNILTLTHLCTPTRKKRYFSHEKHL